MTGAAQTLTEYGDDLLPHERIELFDALVGSGARIRRLMDDLLTASRLEARALDVRPQEVALAPLLAEVLGQARGSADTQSVQLEMGPVDDRLTVLADRGRLQQIVLNLINNAVHHGAPPVEIRVAADSEAVEVAVIDHGPGVPEHVIDRVFERFVTGAPALGTGLGLFIVRELARAQGGDASYERVAGESLPPATAAPWTKRLAEGSCILGGPGQQVSPHPLPTARRRLDTPRAAEHGDEQQPTAVLVVARRVLHVGGSNTTVDDLDPQSHAGPEKPHLTVAACVDHGVHDELGHHDLCVGHEVGHPPRLAALGDEPAGPCGAPAVACEFQNHRRTCRRARADVCEHLHEQFEVEVLQDIALHEGPYTEPVLQVRAGENDDTRLGARGPDAGDHVAPWKIGQAKVEDHDVGARRRYDLDSREAVRGLTHNVEAATHSERNTHDSAVLVYVVDEHNAHRHSTGCYSRRTCSAVQDMPPEALPLVSLPRRERHVLRRPAAAVLVPVLSQFASVHGGARSCQESADLRRVRQRLSSNPS